MSFATLEQETLVVMTELADEEISGVVGGGSYDSYFKAGKVKVDADSDADVKIGKIGKGADVTINNTAITQVAFNGSNTASVYNDNSRDRAYIGWGH